MTGPVWAAARLLAGAAILVALLLNLGAEPFADGLRLVTVPALVTAMLVTSLTTLCCAWRWRLVARALDVEVPSATAFTTYYRSQFLNATLPGGVLGDVHRGVSHGRQVDALGRTLRSVGWERVLGLAMHLTLTLLLLLVVPTNLRSPALLLVLVAVTLVLVVGIYAGGVLRERRARAGILLVSAVAAAGHVVVFLVALSATGVDLSVGLVPMALVVLTASAIPLNVAGWGPREGAAAWAFAGTGLTAAEGVTASVTYGVLVLVATLPGALLLLTGRRHARPVWTVAGSVARGTSRLREPASPQARPGRRHARPVGDSRG